MIRRSYGVCCCWWKKCCVYQWSGSWSMSIPFFITITTTGETNTSMSPASIRFIHPQVLDLRWNRRRISGPQVGRKNSVVQSHTCWLLVQFQGGLVEIMKSERFFGIVNLVNCQAWELLNHELPGSRVNWSSGRNVQICAFFQCFFAWLVPQKHA